MKKIFLLLFTTSVFVSGATKRELSVFEVNKKENNFPPTKVEVENKIKDKNSINSDIKREKIIQLAKKQIGKPYLWGASGNNQFDCSSFVQYVYKHIGVELPRVSYQQAEFKPKINKNIKRGDLLFFETLDKGRISHVGIYIGNGKFIHASSSYKKVVISEFSGFYKETFRWAISIL